jgi:hypothetical protein
MTPSSTNNVWASTAPTSDQAVEELTCPSGQTCLAKRTGLEGLMYSGQLLKLDALTGMVDKKHVRRVRGGNGVEDADELDARSLMGDPKAIKTIVRLADALLPQILVEPRVAVHYTINDDDEEVPIPTEDREPGVVYTDQIDYIDKMYLMNYGMAGTRDAERFRGESGALVGDLVPSETVARNPQRSGPRKNTRKGKRGR